MTKPYPTIEEVIERITREGHGFFERSDIIKAACDLDRERSEAPAEDERIDWAVIPWAKFATADEDGRVFAWESEPVKHGIVPEWVHPLAGLGRVSRINATIPGPWQESLRARPENV